MNTNLKLILVGGYAIISCLVTVSAQIFETPPIALEGTLQIGEFMGPPNYGENPESDRLEHPYYLQLPATINMQTGNTLRLEGEMDSYFVQLFFDDFEKIQPKNFIGKKVKVVGPLVEALTGHQRTPLVLTVESLIEIDGWQW